MTMSTDTCKKLALEGIHIANICMDNTYVEVFGSMLSFFNYFTVLQWGKLYIRVVSCEDVLKLHSLFISN